MRFEHWLYTIPLRWRSLVRRGRVEQDLHDEIEFHLEGEIERYVAQGIERSEARLMALRRFGGVDQAKERCRDARGLIPIDTLLQDVRYTVRTLRRNPGFAVVAVLTLALGIGANSAVFSLVDGILLSRLPYQSPQQLVSVTGTYPNGAFASMRNEVQSIEVAAYAEGHTFTLTGQGEPTRLAGTRISSELFSLLGEKPALGRWLRVGEDAAPHDRFVILSHQLWATQFGGDQSIVGRFINLDGTAREVVGVMPPSFQFPSTRTQLWVPLGLDPGNTVRYWAGDFMPIVGRLRESATMAQAHADVQLFQSRVHAKFPWPMPASWNRNVTVVPLQQAIVGGVRSQLLVLIGAAALVLLIACANVANLNLARAITREREIGIRIALGAGPKRIARQLLTEGVVLASLAAVVGLLFATEGLTILKLVLPADTPRLAEARLNWHVLAFTAGLGILTGCAFGLAPIVQGLRRRSRIGPLRAALTVAQVACAVMLVIAAGLLVRSLWTLLHVDPGFHADQVITARVSPTESLCASSERCFAFYRAFETQLRPAANVRDAAFVNTLPLTGAVAKRSLELEGFKAPNSQVAPLFWLKAITPDYFQVMDIRLELGRTFTREDLSGNPAVAIVTASTADRFWPGQNPLGKHVRFIGEQHWHTIVGVAADVRAYDLTRNEPEWIRGTVYVPYGPNATMEDGRIPIDMTLTLRTTLDGGQASALIRRAAKTVSGEAAISDVKAMRALVADAVAAPAATTSLLATMAALAVLLGCIGVYGVLSFLVSRQMRDLAIRFALGARRSDVLWLVIKEGAVMCCAGIAMGIAGAMAVSRWLASELYGVNALDPVTYVGVAIAIALVTLTACYMPTRRAMKVDPLIVLREQ